MNKRSAWIEVNLDNLRHNVRQVRNAVGDGVQIMGILKADAYGHGFEAVSEVLVQEGVDQFAVATLPEAILLRKKYAAVPILLLGMSPLISCDDIVKYDIDQAVQDFEYVEALNSYAKAMNKMVRVHIKVDTGMSRFGFMHDSDIEDIIKIFSLENIEVAGIFSHFSSSSSEDGSVSAKQRARFVAILDELKKRDIKLPTVHMANSGAIFRHKDSHFDMVRMGIAMFGQKPSTCRDYDSISFKPVMSLKAQVVRVREIKAGEAVGYSATYVLKENEKIATIPVGYADGLSANISDDYRVLFKGGRYPLAGSVCMDALMLRFPVDTDIAEGDVVTFFGEHEGYFVPMEELADAMGIMNYELMCRFKLRLSKKYISGGLVYDEEKR